MRYFFITTATLFYLITLFMHVWGAQIHLFVSGHSVFDWVYYILATAALAINGVYCLAAAGIELKDLLDGRK